MTYHKIFNPSSDHLEDLRDDTDKTILNWADRRDGKIYLYDDEIILAVNVALATGRPLLVQGQSGSGKSALAYNVARVMGRRYYEQVITARTQARDLLWRFDAVRRLGDAQAHGHGSKEIPLSDTYYPYIEPGVLWWVFDRELAHYRGLTDPSKRELITPALDPALYQPDDADSSAAALIDEIDKAEPEQITPALDPALYQPDDADSSAAVVLIDEIDKADPDVPNNLLVPLGSLKFIVEEIQTEVEFRTADGQPPQPRDLPLLIITTNGERELPQAFLRRCVVLTIKPPSWERLLAVAQSTIGSDPERIKLYEQIYEALKRTLKAKDAEPIISIAEYLDTVRACLQLKIDGGSALVDVDEIINKTLWKEADTRLG